MNDLLKKAENYEKSVRDRLLKVTKVISHRSCPDGTMAALICAAGFQAENLAPEIEFMQYGTPEEEALKPEPGQLFIDITPPPKRWKEWKDVDPIVLDHHETRQHITEGLGGVFGYPEYSGASLAFMHVLVPLWERVSPKPYVRMPSLEDWARFSVLAQIRDNWQTEDPAWLEAASFAQGLMFHGSRDLLKEVEDTCLNLDEVLKIGTKAYERILRKAKYVAASSYVKEVSLKGESYKLAFFNTTEKNTSEVSHHLIDVDKCDLAVSFFSLYQGGGLKIVVSLRTNERLNARKIAEVFEGGGGHPRAAGFKMNGPGGGDALDHTFGDIVGYVEGAMVDVYVVD